MTTSISIFTISSVESVFFLLAVRAQIVSNEAVRLAATTLPRQLGAKRKAEIVDRVCDDDVVVESNEQVYDDLSITQTYFSIIRTNNKRIFRFRAAYMCLDLEIPLKRGHIFSKACIGVRPLNCPIEISRKNVGMPTRKSRVKKGTRKAAPPFLNTRNGNRQTLPRPLLY